MGQRMVFFCVMAIAVSLTSTAWTEDFGSYSVATVGSDGGSGGGSYTDVRTALATYEGKTSSSTENNRQASSEPATIPAVLKEMYGKEVVSSVATQITPDQAQTINQAHILQTYISDGQGGFQQAPTVRIGGGYQGGRGTSGLPG